VGKREGFKMKRGGSIRRGRRGIIGQGRNFRKVAFKIFKLTEVKDMKKLITITLMMMSMLGCQQIKPEEITKPLNDKISAIEEKIKSIESWIEEQKKAAEEAPKTAQEMSKAIGDLKKSVDELKAQISGLSSRVKTVEDKIRSIEPAIRSR
jgi:septal ring factor EnvC (AmiA/AmiB activator)